MKQAVNSETKRLYAYACLVLSMVLVGTYVALSKPLAMTFPVFLLAWMRFGIGGVAMLHWLKPPANEPEMSSRTRVLIFLESLFGNFLFTLCMIFGVKLTSATAAGVAMAAIPAAVAAMSWCFLKERVSGQTWIAVACAVAGISLFFAAKQNSLDASEQAFFSSKELYSWLGQCLLIGAVLCEAAYSVIGKKLTDSIGAHRIASLINFWGFVLATPLGIYAALQFDFVSVPWSMWLLLLFYALAASMWSVWLWMTGLRTVAAAHAGIFTIFLPVSAAVVGVMALGESLAPLQWVAFAIALTSVLLATIPVTRNFK